VSHITIQIIDLREVAILILGASDENQFSTFKYGTRLKSCSLLVTQVRSLAFAVNIPIFYFVPAPLRTLRLCGAYFDLFPLTDLAITLSRPGRRSRTR